MEHRRKVGVVGLGFGAGIARAYAAYPDTELVAVCCRTPEKAACIAAELSATAYTDHRQMLAAEALDLVYVAVPPAQHHPVVMDVLAAGRHVICEKPLALHLAEAEAMADRAGAVGVVAGVNIIIHMLPEFRRFRQMVQDGHLGTIVHLDLTLVLPAWPYGRNAWVTGREQGGPVREILPHPLHAISHTFGPIKRVRASQDLAHMELETGQTAAVTLLTGVAGPQTESLTAYGTDKTLSIRNLMGSQRQQLFSGDAPIKIAPGPWSHPIAEQLKAISGQPSALVTFAEGVRVQRVLDAWLRSAAAGGTWATVQPAPAPGPRSGPADPPGPRGA